MIGRTGSEYAEVLDKISQTRWPDDPSNADDTWMRDALLDMFSVDLDGPTSEALTHRFLPVLKEWMQASRERGALNALKAVGDILDVDPQDVLTEAGNVTTKLARSQAR